ncbi:C-type lectin 37Db-like [Coccinella septempunctata]|uniref:C-type lectin 37Db-like n=1 Tax=Coccinella septempunctata TaxID=41139 RepID=UPI001D06D07F|nr:C-type lectin 37Db-like [Coccinella septempunctata]
MYKIVINLCFLTTLLNVTLLKMTKFSLLFVFASFCLFTGGTSSLPTNDKPGPLWIIQMGNRDNLPNSPRGMMISHNSVDSTNPYQLMNDKMIDYVNSQTRKNSLLPLEELNGNYYYFVKYFKTNFFKAMQFCKENGMDLLSLETGEEYMAIVSYLKKHYPKAEHIWTSGTDAGEEGSFVWLSTGRSVNFTSWGAGLPDNSAKIEHCLEIARTGVENYYWNDRACNSEYNFICELRE